MKKFMVLFTILAAGGAYGVQRYVTARQGMATGGGADAGPAVKTLSWAGGLDIREHAVPGAVTIFDFYADWCGPCTAIDPHLKRLAASHDDIYLRKIDIRQWNTPIAKQYGINSIPSMWVFDASGRLIIERESNFAEVRRAVLREVN